MSFFKRIKNLYSLGELKATGNEENVSLFKDPEIKKPKKLATIIDLAPKEEIFKEHEGNID